MCMIILPVKNELLGVCGIDVYVVVTNFYVPIGFIYLGTGMFVVIIVLSLTGVFEVERRACVFDSQYGLIVTGVLDGNSVD